MFFHRMMQRRGGKRIRMDDPPPDYEMTDLNPGTLQHIADNLNESFSDHGGEGHEGGEGASTSAAGRMTRLRARGGVRDKPPIIDDDIDEIIERSARKRKPPKPKVHVEREKPERIPKEKHDREPTAYDKERDVTQDESSLYYIIRHSKAAIAVSFSFYYLIYY